MATMRRVTRTEAAAALGVSEEEVSEQIASGSMVACQEPAFRNHVWLRSDVKPATKRKTRTSTARTSRKKTPSKETVLSEPVGPAEEPVPTEAAIPSSTELLQLVSELQESVTKLKEDLDRQGSEIARIQTDLETGQQEFQRPPLTLQQLGVETDNTLTIKERGTSQDLDPSGALLPADAEGELETVFNMGGQPEPKPFQQRIWSTISTTRIALAALRDMKLGRVMGKTWLRFSPPLLS